MIVCSGSSMPHLRAIIRDVAGIVETDTGAKPANAEGKADSRWVVLDYIDVMVHVMHEEMREFYGLEELWADAKELEWSPANGGKGNGGERKSNIIH
jgi:ribosome-associated protein